ncbi:hypothetical protein [uncultured Paludibaculum sp.]|uniref:hypothetical protein n=1 Tax=uncultured Paludibaculum sp. TaxID=1765020 RepID=UPI002AAC2DEF|nr:hypothetical protein [uncultured Paludibaculum sp.]
MNIRTIPAGAICLLVLLLPTGFTQQPVKSSTQIDGSKNPELIPLDEAFKSMFLMLCDGPVPRPMSVSGREYYMRGSGLTEKQQDSVSIAAVKYRLAVNDAVASAKAALKGPASELAARRQAATDELNFQFEDIRKSLESDLGPDAYQELVHFVETEVKSRMTMGRAGREK